MEGQLFSSDFLLRGIAETDAWRNFPETELDAFIAALKGHFAPFSADSTLNEGQTEDELVEPIVDLLGWTDAWTSQVNLSQSGREDVPDFLLFPDPAAKLRALAVSDADRARHGVALLEAKRWLRPLDRSDDTGKGETRKRRDFGAPSSQMLRYLSRADVMSDRAVKWGILTNGALWRLYWQDARSRAEDFFEIDLAALLDVPGTQVELGALDPRHGLKVFFLFFGRTSFLPQAWDSQRRSFHAIALDEARLYEETVSEELGQRVFADVFPALCQALASGDLQSEKDRHGHYTTAYLDEVREAALILLYRLLFLFYAEDRRLLPVMDSRYAPYSLSQLRDEIAAALDHGKVLSGRIANFWGVLDNLFTIIAEGDDTLGMPAYNGGLFERGRSFILARVKVPDAALAPAIDALSRRTDLLKARINYRDLSVTHLGGVYERLLEYRLEQAEQKLAVAKASFARKGSGSYYTHDALVRLILDETLGRLAAERQAEFDKRLARLRKKPEIKPYDWDALDAADPASRLLELKICDPAMGSGHFLVALVDWLADRTLEAAQSSAQAVGECAFAAHLEEKGRPWTSPVVNRIADIRRRIVKAAETHGWTVDPKQLDDRHIVRRMIIKRVVFGVDKNPMAVELAKVGLWLHTFTVGAPLSFLDHHLQCGDSLHGERLAEVRAGMEALGTMFQGNELKRLEIAAKSLESVADLTDVSIAEAHESKRLALDAAAEVAPIHALLDLWRGLRWRVPNWPQTRLARLKDDNLALALGELFSGRYNLVGVALAGRIDGEGEAIAAANRLLADALALARRERFFHWQTAFPTVWNADGQGGFDALIGNPPWDRIKMQEVEWFAERRPEIALQARAADRKALIEREEKRKTPLWRDYLAARDAAESGARVLRECGDYPLLSGGDTNLYSLFVERTTALVSAPGIVGLLTPSGIAADKGASDFFRTLTDADEDGSARLAALFDFENRGNPGGSFFPDVDSRFKFCALIFGGDSRRFAQSSCAFFLQDTAELADPARTMALSSVDFRLVNPNTGAAPIFRSPRDAALTLHAYRAHPVLVDRSGGSEQRVWPVRYVRMFDMTNDSHRFLTREVLKKQGFVPATLGRWRGGESGTQEAWPLYVGRMIHQYDHRHASVTVNEDNLHNAASGALLTAANKADPACFPEPQYRIVVGEAEPCRAWSIGFRDIARATDMRTMIASILPGTLAGNTLPLLLPHTDEDEQAYIAAAPLLLANLNSLAFDYIARQKAQTTHLNWYILEQLPVIAPEAFEYDIGDTRIADFIRAEVLALSYTAHDLAPFARDIGHVDAEDEVLPPFVWDAEDRAQRLARLDALFFHLYGFSAKEVDYVLRTFPIVREQEIKAHGRFVSRERILAQLQRIEAGQLDHSDIQP